MTFTVSLSYQVCQTVVNKEKLQCLRVQYTATWTQRHKHTATSPHTTGSVWCQLQGFYLLCQPRWILFPNQGLVGAAYCVLQKPSLLCCVVFAVHILINWQCRKDLIITADRLNWLFDWFSHEKRWKCFISQIRSWEFPMKRWKSNYSSSSSFTYRSQLVHVFH